jgi:hypothetical protein
MEEKNDKAKLPEKKDCKDKSAPSPGGFSSSQQL